MNGKFSSRIAEYLHSLSLDSCHDEETGDVGELGWYARFDGLITLSPEEITRSGLTRDDLRELRHMAGAILMNDNDGFVYADTYDSAEKLAARWARIEDAYAALDTPEGYDS